MRYLSAFLLTLMLANTALASAPTSCPKLSSIAPFPGYIVGMDAGPGHLTAEFQLGSDKSPWHYAGIINASVGDNYDVIGTANKLAKHSYGPVFKSIDGDVICTYQIRKNPGIAFLSTTYVDLD